MIRAGKVVVLFNVPDKCSINIKTEAHWADFLTQCSPELLHDIRERATPEEWMPDQQSSFFKTQISRFESSDLVISTEPATAVDLTGTEAMLPTASKPADMTPANALLSLNEAFAKNDPDTVLRALAGLVKTHHKKHTTEGVYLAHDNLCQSLNTNENPGFAIVLKVFSLLGFRLNVSSVGNPDVGD